MKRKKDCAVRAQGQDKRHYLASQNNFEQDHFSFKKLRRSNLNMVKLAYTQSHAKGSTGTCLLPSGLWKKQVSQDSSYNRQNRCPQKTAQKLAFRPGNLSNHL